MRVRVRTPALVCVRACERAPLGIILFCVIEFISRTLLNAAGWMHSLTLFAFLLFAFYMFFTFVVFIYLAYFTAFALPLLLLLL